jgi:hypothetical protein
MDARRGRLAAALTAATMGVAAFAGSAQAATITSSPPAFAKPGTGPFTWTFAPSVAGTPVAWKLSSEIAWHRCTSDTAATFATLPEGGYTLSVVDDAPDCSASDTGAPLGPPPPPSRRPQLIVDGTAPAVPAPVVTVGPATVPWARHVTISAPATDALSGVASITWNPGDGATPAPGTPRSAFVHNYALGLFAGSVTVVDRAGNTATKPFTVDTRPPPDVTPPAVAGMRLGAAVLRRNVLPVSFTLSERATATITARIRAAGHTYRLPVAQRTLLGNRLVTIRVPVKAAVRRAIARALHRHRAVRATVGIVAVDRAGNRRSATGATSLTG